MIMVFETDLNVPGSFFQSGNHLHNLAYNLNVQPHHVFKIIVLINLVIFIFDHIVAFFDLVHTKVVYLITDCYKRNSDTVIKIVSKYGKGGMIFLIV